MDNHVRARQNVERAFASNRGFPEQVFVQGWGGFHFFEDVYMRESAFVEIAQLLLDLDGGNCVCVINADEGTQKDVGPSSLYLDRGATAEAFGPAVEGSTNWLTCMVISAASSDKGEWCAYCEPMADLAVMAFRTPALLEGATDILARLNARPAAVLKDVVGSWAWTQAPAFFATLVRNYGSVDWPRAVSPGVS
jgi:hypothetical protein